MDGPVTFAGQGIMRVEIQSPAIGHKGLAMAADLSMTQAANGVLEYAQTRQDAHGIEQVHHGQEKAAHRLHSLGQSARQHDQPQSAKCRDCAHLDFRFLLLS